jgi:uncharacterized membrane protein
MMQLLLGLVIFLGMHSVAIIAPAWRAGMSRQLGMLPWKALYALVSLLGFWLIVRGYAAARLDPVVLYTPPAALRHLTYLLMLPVFPLLLAAYLPGRIKARVKHPMLTATKAWATAHLLANGMLADVLLFGGFLAWAVLDRISLKKRSSTLTLAAPTSALNDIIAVLAGLALYALFVMWGHTRLIGVPVM